MVTKDAARLRVRQVRHWDALMGHPHEAGPHLYRQSAAGRLPGRRIVIIAEPYAGHEIGGVADEPRVAEILAGAGAAGGRPARALPLARGAPGQSFLHHGVHHRATARFDALAKVIWEAGIQPPAPRRGAFGAE